MSTLGEIRSLILRALARDDNDAVLVADAAINYAIMMASLSFEPPEACRESDVILTGGSNMLYFPYLVTDIDIDEDGLVGMFELDPNGDLMPIAGNTLATNLLDIIKVYNKTGAYKLDFIPYEYWDTIIPSALDELKYWTLFGNTLYVKNTPSTNKYLTISYTTYPVPLTDETQSLPFAHYDSFIVSSATSIAWAIFEEQDPSTMWASIANFVGSPSALGSKAKALIEGQRVMIESIAAQIKSQPSGE